MDVVGRHTNRQCYQCHSDAKRAFRQRAAEIEAERVASAERVAVLIDGDIEGMRERARLTRCVDCGGHGHVETRHGRLCWVCRGRRVERMRAA